MSPLVQTASDARKREFYFDKQQTKMFFSPCSDNFRKYHCAVRNVYRMRTEGALAPFVTLNVTCDHSPRRRDPEVFRAVRCLTKECQHLDQSCVGDETPGRFTVVPSYERKFIDKPVRYMPTNPKLNFIRHWVDIPVGCSCVWRPN